MTNELQLLIESLEKKRGILKDILKKSRQQGEVASSEQFDAERFDSLVDEKSELLIRMDEMDQGFDSTFNRIKEELLADKDTYKKEIARMQGLIRETVDLGAQIHATEVRTKESLERTLKNNRQELLKRRTSSKSVRDYYKANSQLDFVGSYFIDQKK